MAVDAVITDELTKAKPASGIPKTAVNPLVGLVTYTPFYPDGVSRRRPFLSDEFGSNLNIDALPDGAVENVHDGDDNAYWTDTASHAKWLISNEQNHTGGGTFSIKANDPPSGTYMSFTESPDFTITDGSVLKGWVYISSLADVTFDVQGFNSTIAIGSSVDLLDAVSRTTLNQWQQFVIPVSAIGLGDVDIDELRVTCTRISSSGNVIYLDDIAFQDSSVGDAIFALEPEPDTIMELQTLSLYFENSAVEGQGQTGISGSGILGETFANGYVFRAINILGLDSITLVHDFRDIIQTPNVSIQSGGDATNMWVKVDIDFSTAPIYLDSRRQAKLDYVLLDDFSGLTAFTAHAGYKSRVISPDISRDPAFKPPAQSFVF